MNLYQDFVISNKIPYETSMMNLTKNFHLYYEFFCFSGHHSLYRNLLQTTFFTIEKAMTRNTSREQTFDPRPKWTLVLAFFAPGTRDTFSPVWWLQPGLKVPAQRLLRQTEAAGTFSPGQNHQPGLKVDFYSRLVAPTGTKGLYHLCLVQQPLGGTFSHGWSHQPGLKIPPLYLGRLLLPP